MLGVTNRPGARCSPTSTLKASGGASKKSQDAVDHFGYITPDVAPALNRDVFRFLHSLDMTHPIRDPRRDLCNGFLVAEILSRFYPADVLMHAYQNGTSSHCKRDNWGQIQRICNKHSLPLPEDMVEGTKAGRQGAATALLEHLYETLTKKKLQRMQPIDQMAGMDAAQAALPLSFGEPAAADNGGLKAIRAAAAGAGPGVTFGQVQTALVGEAAALRKKFAAGRA